MNISPKLVRFDENSMWVELLDGRIIGVPLVWFLRLLRAKAGAACSIRTEPAGYPLGRTGRRHFHCWPTGRTRGYYPPSPSGGLVGYRQLTPQEIEGLREDMRQSSEWARLS